MKSSVFFVVIFLLASNVLFAGDLHEAAINGDLEKVKLQLNRNGNVDERDNQGVTPLIWASAYGKEKVVKYLLSKGANVNATLKNGVTALIMAAQYGENEVATILVNSGARINAKEQSGSTALHAAVNKDNKIGAVLLVKSGADINSQTDNGKTALYIAAMRGNESIVDLLLKKKANPNLYLKKSSGPARSPLLIAAWNKSINHKRYTSVIKQLLENGAKDNWLSKVPGFDANKFSQLTLSRNKNGTTMVGSMPFILGQYYADQSSKNQHSGSASGIVTATIGKGGTNFFSWENKSSKDMATIVTIEDTGGNTTLGRVLPPAFIGDHGIIYSDGVNSIKEAGPFAKVEVNWEKRSSSGKALLIRNGKSIKLKFKKAGSASYTLENVLPNEPITINFMDGNKSLNDIEIDCVFRGATTDSVSYVVNYGK